jgi:hypothetical protein
MRNLVRNKINTSLNVTGLAIGVVVCLLLIALITVTIQSLKAAMANPVKSLKTE